MSQVTCLPVASSVLHFTGVPPAGTPLGTVPAGLLLFIPSPCRSQPRHTTPSERANARARTSRVSSAPFSEQRPRFGSTERARSLTKTPARRQISDPRFPVGGEKKTSGNLARGSYASTPRRVTAGTAERGTMAEPNPAETGEVKTLWVGDLVSAPSRRAFSCPARQPPIFWSQPGSFSRSDG